jgi:hypothetical protein
VEECATWAGCPSFNQAANPPRVLRADLPANTVVSSSGTTSVTVPLNSTLSAADLPALVTVKIGLTNIQASGPKVVGTEMENATNINILNTDVNVNTNGPGAFAVWIYQVPSYYVRTPGITNIRVSVPSSGWGLATT